MDTNESPANSKVIVQCTDPNNLFESLQPRLSARSPLRNLHWKSPNRPLRSIPTLNVSLTREDKLATSQAGVRRHQIPGLRETPYVKLYLLRCDDKETYKEKVRKEVRQWVKAQAPAGEGKAATRNPEGHDAFEWLIVHVVLPNTPAASQAKSSKHISLEATESTDSVNSKSKWSGKSPSTIFDKLRADFSSSKSSINRVAQVRLLEPGDKSAALTTADLEEQWQDLVESLKQCILRSFDARVAQYELDIRERDAQRALPGWNFCTFFVLKEGLAKGFESVGLLEDALAVYDELSLGLDALVKEQAQKDDHDDGGALRNFSKESKDLLRAALDQESNHAPPSEDSDPELDLNYILTVDRENFPFDVERKNYRNLILSNEVSALDLRVYLFTREMEILIRQGRIDPIKSSEASKPNGNLSIVGDLVERATQFITLAARSLRLELYNAWGGQEGLSEDELLAQSTLTGNIVSTWEWCAVSQILAQALPALGMDSEYGTGSLALDAVELSSHADIRLNDQPLDLPSKRNRMSLAPDVALPSRERSQDRNKRLSVIPNGISPRPAEFSRTGSQRLALWISTLLILGRRVIENLPASKPWTTQMKQTALQLNTNGNGALTPNGEPDASSDQTKRWPVGSPNELTAGLKSSTLKAVASSKANYSRVYTLLSVLAYRITANAKAQAVTQRILTDLAEMEYSQANFAIAARYLQSILGPLPRSTYRPSDSYLLRIYADCLKHLERPNEFARCLISCLHSTSQDSFPRLQCSLSVTNQSYVDQLFQVLNTITATTLPAATLFHVSEVSRNISPLDNRDGFAVSIHIRCVSGTSTPPIDSVRLRLVSQDGNEPRFLNLRSLDAVAIEAEGSTITLESAVTTLGWYTPDEVELCLGNLRLLHHFPSESEAGLSLPDDPRNIEDQAVPLLIYPSYRSFGVKMYPFPIIHLAEIRRLLLQVRPGSNDVRQCKLQLKTGTAGLRLHIHDSKLVGDKHHSQSLKTAREGDSLLMLFDELDAESITEVEIPYSLEIASEPSVTLHIEATYETHQGIFTLHDTQSVKVILPVTVNVQDVFRSHCMYSRFTISPSTMVPLRVINCKLEETDSYDTLPGGQFNEPLVVFPKQPANWTVRLRSKNPGEVARSQRMTLVVEFQSLDGVILAILETEFLKAILETRHAYAGKLLVSHLLDRVRTTWTEQDVEVAGLLQEFEIWKMEDMDWPSVLCAFERTSRAEIEGWLRDWHSNTPPVDFSSPKVPQRQLRLFVDVPPPPVLISASFDMELLRSGKYTATIGQPVMADLVIKLENSHGDEMEGTFELVAPSDAWLIGGRRKGIVRLTQEPVRTQVVLFPQYLGQLLLPAISIKCRRKGVSGTGDGWADVASDVYNPAQGRSILITPDLRSTSVEVFGLYPDDGVGRLVASEKKH